MNPLLNSMYNIVYPIISDLDVNRVRPRVGLDWAIRNKNLLKFSPHLKSVAALPCET